MGPAKRAAILLPALFLAAEVEGGAAPGAGKRPGLAVVFVIDQLQSGKLEAMGDRLTGGLGRLLREGHRFTACAHDHASTQTGPGHATLLSGLNPRRNGIIANDWYDPLRHADVYCVGDTSEDAKPSFGDEDSSPMSADNLRDENLSDRIKSTWPGSKVYAVSAKDRSAILSGGHRPDGAFWFDSRTGGFTSNPSIMPALPRWGNDFWGERLLESRLFKDNVPATWVHPERPGARPDDYPYEDPAFSRTSPHPLAGQSGGATRNREIARNVYNSPWIDWLTIRLAGTILGAEGLGKDDTPDLLVVALSGLDLVGHRYGPDSQEHLDLLLRLDAWMGELIQAAESSAGIRGVIFALSSDHGVLPLPETLPGARRIDGEGLRHRAGAELKARWGEGADSIIESFGTHLYLDRRALTGAGLSIDEAIERVRRTLSGFPEIARVYRAADLSGTAGGDEFLRLQANSYDPERGGDLVLQPCSGCLITSSPVGTSHGTPYDYDRGVPMIFMGAGVTAGEDTGECATIDLAPTLASVLGVEFDTPRDGRALGIAP